MLNHSVPSTMMVTALRDNPTVLEQAAAWFHSKWDVPVEAYRNSMYDCIAQPMSIPQWYVVRDANGEIIAGAGVIENDFHNRRDLTPNLCALFVEKPYRQRGIARQLLDFARQDIGKLGYPQLYLVTDHTDFYEHCGWEFIGMAIDDDGVPERLYAAPTLPSEERSPRS